MAAAAEALCHLRHVDLESDRRASLRSLRYWCSVIVSDEGRSACLHFLESALQGVLQAIRRKDGAFVDGLGSA
jgi:hypothetical protein